MLRLGLTGGIGAGKSTVSHRLAERGATVVDADRLAREVVEPGTDGLAEVVAAFGSRVLTPDGALDRAALGRVVFADEVARRRLNGILHPRIAALTAERMRAAGDDAVVVHDVPLLVENRLAGAYHLVLVVHADADERVARLVRDRGMAEQDARARVAAQVDDAARRAAADVWLDNGGTRDELVRAVDALWDDRIAPFAENLRRGRPADGEGGAGTGGVDGAALDRVRARLVHAVGDVGAGATALAPAHVVVTLAAPAAADELRGRLAAAGFVRVPAAAAGELLLRSADPGLPLSLHLRWPAGDGTGGDAG